jgi:F-type H+-transporting ATPase subunit a
LLELFVGLIQAVVFGMLTMVFMSQATQGHGEHPEEAH